MVSEVARWAVTRLLDAAAEPEVHEGAQAAKEHGAGGRHAEHDVHEVIEGAVGALLARDCADSSFEIHNPRAMRNKGFWTTAGHLSPLRAGPQPEVTQMRACRCRCKIRIRSRSAGAAKPGSTWWTRLSRPMRGPAFQRLDMVETHFNADAETLNPQTLQGSSY